MHIRDRIRKQVALELEGLGWRTYPMRRHRLEEKELPAILVYALGGASEIAGMGEPNEDRSLLRDERIVVEAVAVGEAVDVDDILGLMVEKIEAKLARNASLRTPEGVDLVHDVQLIQSDIEVSGEGTKPMAACRMTYRVPCVTTTGDPENAH